MNVFCNPRNFNNIIRNIPNLTEIYCYNFIFLVLKFIKNKS